MNKEIVIVDNEEKKDHTSTIKLNQKAIELVKNYRIDFRKRLIREAISKYSNELIEKIDILFHIALNDVHKETNDSMTYLYEEQFPTQELLTIEVKFQKTEMIYTSLVIKYQLSILRDEIYIDLAKLKVN